MTLLNATPSGLLTLTDCLLTQVEPEDASRLVAVSDTAGGGLVVSGKTAMTVVTYLRGRGYRQALLVDRQRYKGKRRCPASHPFDMDWISRQQRLGLPVVLPDAGYVAAEDLLGLRSILVRSAKINGAIALLALANWWLYGVGLRLLLTEITSNPIGVALVIEHRDDPFSARRVMNGVFALLDTGVPLIPLRCDVSAIGLIANGAVAAAFGSQTSLRHLYPITNGGGGGGSSHAESAVWPAGIALHYSDLLYDAVMADPSNPRWECLCPTCDGLRVDRFSTALTEEVQRHNSASLLQLRDTLTSAPQHMRPGAWKRWCRRAINEHESASIGDVVIKAPDALRNWVAI